jgi:hypothetical protein
MRQHLADNSIDYIVFSPPFQSLYRYSPSVADLSNCQDEATFVGHMAFVASQLFRVIKPGRLMLFHVMNICRRRLDFGDTAANSIIDLRGQLTRIFEDAGFLMHSEVCVFRDPTQALIRTKAQGLFYKTFTGDASIARQALPDYVVTMRKPGANKVPITHDPALHSMEEWIRLACPVWFVKPTNTLNVKKILAAAPGIGKNTVAALVAEMDELDCSDAADDESTAASEVAGEGSADAGGDAGVSSVAEAEQKHPTPLQLEIIEKCVSLWSNAGESVLDPFSGIGSTGYVCKQLKRKYVGIELVDRYFTASLRNV